jgi:hypothetical protein
VGINGANSLRSIDEQYSVQLVLKSSSVVVVEAMYYGDAK